MPSRASGPSPRNTGCARQALSTSRPPLSATESVSRERTRPPPDPDEFFDHRGYSARDKARLAWVLRTVLLRPPPNRSCATALDRPRKQPCRRAPRDRRRTAAVRQRGQRAASPVRAGGIARRTPRPSRKRRPYPVGAAPRLLVRASFGKRSPDERYPGSPPAIIPHGWLHILRSVL
jgi:hypothetical protein